MVDNANIPTLDMGFVFRGSKHSFDIDKGFSFDFSLKKTDENRTVLWSYTYGETVGQLNSWMIDIDTFSIPENTDSVTSYTSQIYRLSALLLLLSQRRRKKALVKSVKKRP